MRYLLFLMLFLLVGAASRAEEWRTGDHQRYAVTADYRTKIQAGLREPGRRWSTFHAGTEGSSPPPSPDVSIDIYDESLYKDQILVIMRRYVVWSGQICDDRKLAKLIIKAASEAKERPPQGTPGKVPPTTEPEARRP